MNVTFASEGDPAPSYDLFPPDSEVKVTICEDGFDVEVSANSSIGNTVYFITPTYSRR